MLSSQTDILVDAHVHIYRTYEISSFLESSLWNFTKIRQQYHLKPPFAYFLLLAEARGSYSFTELQRSVLKKAPDFQFVTVEEGDTLCATVEDDVRLYLVRGRQIITKEKLEILAFGVDCNTLDGCSFDEVLTGLQGIPDCMVVLPWGVGKWLGRRGEIIKEIIQNWNGDSPLFLGDNGNRPRFWSLSKLFADAGEEGMYNLPGSDPLPVAHHDKRAGSYGFMFSADLDSTSPFKSLYQNVSAAPEKIVPYGEPNTNSSFIKEQVFMQINKRLP